MAAPLTICRPTARLQQRPPTLRGATFRKPALPPERALRSGDEQAKRAEQTPRGHPKRQARAAQGSPLTDLARSLAREAATLESALEAEQWASYVEGTWRSRGPLRADATRAFAKDLVRALERRGGDAARAGLTAMGAICSEPAGPLARGASERLAAKGAVEPPWTRALGAAKPIEAKLMYDEIFDDGVNVLVEFDHPDAVHVLGVYIDHNLGVMVKDAFLGGTLAEIAAITADRDGAPVALAPLELDEAAARIAAALELTDMTLAPPVGEDFWSLRALIDGRLAALPEPGELPERPEVSIDEREALVQAFRASADGMPFATDQDALDIVSFAIDFCADYVDGRPLRWSPVVVELFMADWLPRKVLAEREVFERVPEVLPAWIRHAGSLRGIPPEAIETTVRSVDEWIEAMMGALDDEQSFSPAKQFMAAALDAGVDPSDPRGLERFVGDWNDGRTPA